MDMINYIKNCFGMFMFSKEAFDKIIKKATFKLAFLSFLLVYFSSLIINSILEGVKDPLYTIVEMVGGTLILALVMIFLFFIFASIVHIIFRILKAKGTYLDTVRGFLSTSIVPVIISFPFVLLMTIFHQENIFFGIIGFIGFIIFIGLYIYSIIVEITLFSKMHGISQGQSALGVLLGYFIIFLLVIAILAILFFIFVSLIGGFDALELLLADL